MVSTKGENSEWERKKKLVEWDVHSYSGLSLDEEESDRIYLMSPDELLKEANDLRSLPRKKRVASVAFLHYARRCMEIDRWEQVEDTLKIATTLDSKNGAAWFHLGVYQVREYAYFRAGDSFKKACKKQPEIVEHWVERGVVHYILGKWKESKEYLETALNIKRTPRALQFSGLTLLELEQGEKGKKLLEEAHTIVPDDRDILFSLGIVYFRLGETDLANELLQLAVEQSKGKRYTVRRRIRDAVDIGMKQLGSWVVLSDVFERLHWRREAIMCLEFATRILPKNAQAWYELSQIHMNYELYENAVLEAYMLDGSDPNIICAQGEIFYEDGLKKYALDLFVKASSMYPENQTASDWVDKIEEEFDMLEQAGHSPYLGEYGYNEYSTYDDYYD